MLASCRIRAPVETGCVADYHLRMSGDAADSFMVVDRAGPAGRVVVRDGAGGDGGLWVIGGFRGAQLPARLGRAQLDALVGGRYRIAADQGVFDFDASAVDRVVERPSLFETLHRPFALTRKERLAARTLLTLLRLPGGAKLLRLWHAGRSA